MTVAADRAAEVARLLEQRSPFASGRPIREIDAAILAIVRELEARASAHVDVRTMSLSCAVCGRSREDHCVFTPARIPAKCKCEPRDWGDPHSIPDVCAVFVLGEHGTCGTCEHLEECHHD